MTFILSYLFLTMKRIHKVKEARELAKTSVAYDHFLVLALNKWVNTRHLKRRWSILACERVPNGCRFTWLITLIVAQETAKLQKAAVGSQVRFKTSLPAHLSNQNMESQLLDCQSFLAQNITMAVFGGKCLWVWEIFSQYVALKCRAELAIFISSISKEASRVIILLNSINKYC